MMYTFFSTKSLPFKTEIRALSRVFNSAVACACHGGPCCGLGRPRWGQRSTPLCSAWRGLPDGGLCFGVDLDTWGTFLARSAFGLVFSLAHREKTKIAI